MDLAQGDARIGRAWNRVFTALYYPPAHMIYDFLTEETAEASAANLPTPEEIRNSIPNPCGWGTGMEDSTLNLGSMLEAVLTRYQLTGEPEMKQYADMLYEGLRINGEAAPEPGFIARAVCPADGKSVYMDSSRDQYTHWVYAALAMFRSPLADEPQKETLKKILIQVAEKVLRDVRPENDGALLRLDGKPGIVSGMDTENMAAHEHLRMPMFYLAAWAVSGENRWLEYYRNCRERLLQLTEREFTREYAEKNYSYAYAVLQMQYSLRLLWDCETEPAYRERYRALMERAADFSGDYVLQMREKHEILSGVEALVPPWRTLPAYYSLHYGYAYYIPKSFDLGENSYSRLMRNGAEGIVIQCLCPGYRVPEKVKQAFFDMVEWADFDHAVNYWPVLFCDAWWLLRAGLERE